MLHRAALVRPPGGLLGSTSTSRLFAVFLVPTLQTALKQLGKIKNLSARTHGLGFFRLSHRLYFSFLGLLFNKFHDLILERIAELFRIPF